MNKVFWLEKGDIHFEHHHEPGSPLRTGEIISSLKEPMYFLERGLECVN